MLLFKIDVTEREREQFVVHCLTLKLISVPIIIVPDAGTVLERNKSPGSAHATSE